MNFRNMPKIELHCHLDGSARPETLLNLAVLEDIKIPSYDLDVIKKMVTAPWECKSLSEYLERFDIPLLLMQSKDSLRRVTYELLEDAAKENVKYIEIRFAPTQHIKNGLTIEDTIDSVLLGMRQGQKDFDIKCNLILSCMRNLSTETAFLVIEKGKKYIGQGVVAIDLCSVEDKSFAEKFQEPIALAKEYGYRVTIHAGESGIGENVLEAVKILGAERIGHGVFIMDCQEAYKIVKDNGVTLEMCPTSNIQTKAVNKLSEHPFYDFYNDGIKVTINTDNRTVSNTTMSGECELLSKEFGITFEEYKCIYLNSVDAAFTDFNTKNELRQYINNFVSK